MSADISPTASFAQRLPQEMVQAVLQESYPDRLGRAHLPLENSDSLSGVLEQAWNDFQGADNPQIAESQLSHFVTEIFSQAGLAVWLIEPVPNEYRQTAVALETAIQITSFRRPWERQPAVTNSQLASTFTQTPFATGSQQIMLEIVRTSASRQPNLRRQAVHVAFSSAVKLGGTAMRYYEEYVTPKQQPPH